VCTQAHRRRQEMLSLLGKEVARMCAQHVANGPTCYGNCDEAERMPCDPCQWAVTRTWSMQFQKGWSADGTVRHHKVLLWVFSPSSVNSIDTGGQVRACRALFCTIGELQRSCALISYVQEWVHLVFLQSLSCNWRCTLLPLARSHVDPFCRGVSVLPLLILLTQVRKLARAEAGSSESGRHKEGVRKF